MTIHRVGSRIGTPMWIESLFRKHRRLLSIVGAGIVLGTFVFKDAAREKAKDLAEAVNSAQRDFLLRDDMRMLSTEIENAQREVIAVRMKLEPHGPEPKIIGGQPSLNMDWAMNLTGEMQERIVVDLNNTSGLLKAMPKDPADSERLQRLYERLEALRHDHEEAQVLLKQFHGTDKQMFDRLYSLLKKLDPDARELSTDTNKFAGEILRKAGQTAEASERRYQRFAMISYGLYFLGWLLGFWGKLLGAKG